MSELHTARAPLTALLSVAALAAAAGVHAESLYVVEQLVVNVNSAPDASGERMATVKSGDRLEVLERVGDQVHVRLANGRDGWVRATYLTKDEPLHSRLAQREADVAQLKDEVSRLQGELAAAHTAPATPAAAPAASGSAGASPSPAAATDDPAGPSTGGLFAGPAEGRPYPVWPWALGAALAGLGVGFALGALVLDRYIRRKYGGLRIY